MRKIQQKIRFIFEYRSNSLGILRLTFILSHICALPCKQHIPRPFYAILARNYVASLRMLEATRIIVTALAVYYVGNDETNDILLH